MFLDKLRGSGKKEKPVPQPRKGEVRHVYPVAVVENAAACKCGLGGLYELSINNSDLTLHHISTRQIIYTFPYKFIRRYGRTSKNFQFEAGRRCESGAGLFSLIVEDGLGHEIFSLVSVRFEQIRRQSSLESSSSSYASRSSSSDSDSDETFMPDLPPRNYKTDTLRSLFGLKASSKTRKSSSSSNISSSGSSCGGSIGTNTLSRGQSKPKIMSPTPKRIQPRTYYEEINICDEPEPVVPVQATKPRPQVSKPHPQARKTPSVPMKISSAHPPATKSPSYLNSLIRKNKKPLLAMSNNSQSMDSIYHVLCQSGSQCRSRHSGETYSSLRRPMKC